MFVTRTLIALSILYSITRDPRAAERCKTFHCLCSRIVTLAALRSGALPIACLFPQC
jgi:hypothetical protein